MTANVETTTNLFPYLMAEEQHRDYQADEALFLTFNVDLGYFEARLLGLLRATGARVAIIVDAHVWAPDIRAVKHAGRSYQLGLVDQPTAFHPKLLVLVGPKRALAAVGSGNLTMAGWQYNRELLTVFTGDTEHMPIAFTDIRSALSTLWATETLDPISARAVARTIRSLDTLLGSATSVDTGHRVHASWMEPLIDTLPTESVAELCLSAAFHDPGSIAVRNLLGRLRPRRVQVTVQPGWTHLDPAALDRVLSGYAAQSGAQVALLQDPESRGTDRARYRHGKLIEWATHDGRRRAMTGSPNLSTAALLNRVSEGGNYELAVIGPLTESLFPGGKPVEPENVPALVGIDDSHLRATGDAAVRALLAIKEGDRLTVSLNRPAESGISIEAAHRSDHPDEWAPLGLVRPGAARTTFDASFPAGSRVRALTSDGAPTPPVFVVEESRVLTTSIPDKRVPRTHTLSASDLFGEDRELLDLLKSEFEAYAQDINNARAPVVPRDGVERVDGGRERDRDDPIEPWLWLQEDTVRRYGPSIASWRGIVKTCGWACHAA